MSQLATKPLNWIKTNPQVRMEFDEADLRLLGESLKVKQLQPLVCQPDGTLIIGERRLRAAMLVGITHLEVKIVDEPVSDVQIQIWQLTENLLRDDLKGYEQWLGCQDLMRLRPEWKQKDLAEHLHLSESMIVRLLSPSRCTEEWQEALRQGTVGISDCYAASKLPLAEQVHLLALRLSGASRDAIEAAGRKTRKVGGQAVHASRIKCLLPSGVQIVMSGEKLTLDDTIDAFAEAGKEARKARTQGLHIKTFEAALRDRNRRPSK